MVVVFGQGMARESLKPFLAVLPIKFTDYQSFTSIKLSLAARIAEPGFRVQTVQISPTSFAS
jgi:hypothetical protein